MRLRIHHLAAAIALSVAVAGCSGDGAQVDQRYPAKGRTTSGTNNPEYGEPETVFGDGGISLFGGGRRQQDDQSGGGIGVNAFLWRASLDTVAFMPLASADPFGGVIITDWYAPPEAPDERFKATVYILDRQLRADGVRVAIFKQRRSGTEWVNAEVDPKLATELENSILARARELRVAGRQ